MDDLSKLLCAIQISLGESNQNNSHVSTVDNSALRMPDW